MAAPFMGWSASHCGMSLPEEASHFANRVWLRWMPLGDLADRSVDVRYWDRCSTSGSMSPIDVFVEGRRDADQDEHSESSAEHICCCIVCGRSTDRIRSSVCAARAGCGCLVLEPRKQQRERKRHYTKRLGHGVQHAKRKWLHASVCVRSRYARRYHGIEHGVGDAREPVAS